MEEKKILTFSSSKARNKILELLLYSGLIFVFLVLISSDKNLVNLLLPFLLIFSFIFLPQIIIHINYVNNDKFKKVIFDYHTNTFQQFFKDELMFEIKLSEIKKVIYFKGLHDQSYGYGILPHSHYNFYKICTKTNVFIFSEFMTCEDEFVLPKLDFEKVRFFNLMNSKNTYIAQQNKVRKQSELRKNQDRQLTLLKQENVMVSKFIKQYDSKSEKELRTIVINQKDYQKEAVKAAEIILKGRNT